MMKGGDWAAETAAVLKKTYSQLISDNNFKEKGQLGSADKTKATHEKIFTLTLFMFLRNIFCLSPCFQHWTQLLFQPASSSPPTPPSPGQQNSFHSPLKSVFIWGHLDSLTTDSRKREKKKSSLSRFSACCWVSGTWKGPRSTEGNNKSSAPSLPTHSGTSKKPRIGQSKREAIAFRQCMSFQQCAALTH